MEKMTNPILFKLQQLYGKLERGIDSKTINDLIITKDNIIYQPEYQRKYVWDNKKAVQFIETVLIDGIIPPLTMIKANGKLTIIDGRQRYETLLKFYHNEFKLEGRYLEKLKDLHGKSYQTLPKNMRTIFKEYKMKLITYTLPDGAYIPENIELLALTERNLFRRYNSGMTPLTKADTARARYLNEFVTNELTKMFEQDKNFYEKCINVFLPKKKREYEERERINLLLLTIREMLVMPYIPIIGEKSIGSGAFVVDSYYNNFIKTMTEEQKLNKIQEFIKIAKKIYIIKDKLEKAGNPLKDNTLFFKSMYWMLAILYQEHSDEFYRFDSNHFYHYIEPKAAIYFDQYMSVSTNHILNRHLYMEEYITKSLKLNIDDYLTRVKENKKIFAYYINPKINKNENWAGIGNVPPIVTYQDTFQVSEIIRYIKEERFIVQADFQRGEVKNKEKASRLIESILLGIALPPIYIFKEVDQYNISKYTVLDGQQRLISILKFMGEPVTNSECKSIKTYKDKYALTGLKDLKELEGKTYYHENEKNTISPEEAKKILDYKIEVIRIDEKSNRGIDLEDIFLRLNQNPCPISDHSFEMWNSLDIVNTINKIKEVAKYDLFKQYGNRMKEEELVTILAYMDAKKIKIENMNTFLKFYLYSENKEKLKEEKSIKISSNKKDVITNFLEKLVPDSQEEQEFIKSVNEVNVFAEKLKILSNHQTEKLIKIFNPYITPRTGNKSDFYITWLIVHELDIHLITTYKDEIMKDLEELFKIMKKMPEGKEEKYFIHCLTEVRDKYAEMGEKNLA
jgi:hypothetical protein